MSFDTQDMDVIRRSAMFGGLDDEQFHMLVPRLRVVRVAKGVTLFERGEPAVACFVMIAGWVKLIRRDAGDTEVVINVFGPRDSFAEALIMPKARYPATAVAVTDVRFLRVDTAELRTAIATDSRLALSLIAGCYQHLHGLVDQMERQRGWPARRRLAGFLVTLCAKPGGPAEIEWPYERTLVAARLGMTLDTLARSLAALASYGVAAAGTSIRIADVAALVRLTYGTR